MTFFYIVSWCITFVVQSSCLVASIPYAIFFKLNLINIIILIILTFFIYMDSVDIDLQNVIFSFSFVTQNKSRICVDPELSWVQGVMKDLDEKSF